MEFIRIVVARNSSILSGYMVSDIEPSRSRRPLCIMDPKIIATGDDL